MSKGHHFLSVKFESTGASQIRVRVNPTQGMGWQTLDDDGIAVAQVTANTKSISVETTKNGVVSTINYKLNLTLNPNT